MTTTTSTAGRLDRDRRLPPLLPLALRTNAVTSGLAGVVAAAGAAALDDLLGIAAWVLVAIGLGLVGYAVALWRGSASVPVDPQFARFAIGADVAWVVAVAAVLLLAPDAMTPAGRWTAGILTLGVLDLAILQTVGLRRQRRG